MVKHAMQLVLVMSFASLLFACTGGGETPMLEPAAPAKSLSLSLSLSPATQCSNVATIAAGAYHTVGLKDDGTVVAVGYDSNGQVSDVSSWTNITAIAAGWYHTVGLKEDGTVVAVGYDINGRVSGVSTWSNIKAIAAGTYDTVGLKEDGTAVAVGNDSNGQVSGVSSWTNIMPICNPAVALTQDVTPPITISMITGTLGSNEWYVSDVQMTLSATDNDGGSGVKEIHYTVDGTETVVKGSSASNSIASDGTHTVTFYAIDNEGNVETPQKISIKIDKTSPSIPALTVDSAILWPPNHKMVNVLIGGSVADDGGSGIASTIITVTDEYGSCNKTVPGFGSAIPLEAWRESTDMDGRSYTITVVTTDIAGHQSTATKTVLVPHDMR